MSGGARLARVGALLLIVLAVVLELTPGVSVGAVRGTTTTLPLALVAACVALVYSSLLVRWQWPLRVYLVIWAFSLLGLLLPQFSPFVGLLVALHAVASKLPRRTAQAAIVLAAAPMAVNAANGALNRQHLETSPMVSFFGQFSLYLVLALAAWGWGRLSLAARNRADRERIAAAADAIRTEQIRLAREIHDIVSHAVTGMLLQAAGAKTVTPCQDPRVIEALTLIEATGVQAMTELHRLLGLLHAAEDGPHSARNAWQPQVDQLDTLIKLTRASGMHVDSRVNGASSTLDPEVSLAAYRLVQEALTNTVKHAGRGARVAVSLSWSRHQLTVSVLDQTGAEARPLVSQFSAGLGLRGLKDRITHVGGELQAGPIPGGFLVEATFPNQPHNRPGRQAHGALPNGHA